MQVEGSSVRVSSPTAPLATQVIKINWGITYSDAFVNDAMPSSHDMSESLS